MQIYFTQKELEFVSVNFKDGKYAFVCKKNAPQSIKQSIEKKLTEHKKWLRGDE